MGLLSSIKRWLDMIFKQQAEDDFDVKSVVSPEMEVILRRCASIYAGAPPWLSADDDIRTINFAKAVSSETARLATLAIGIQIEGSARAEWLQKQIDAFDVHLREYVYFTISYDTVFRNPT